MSHPSCRVPGCGREGRERGWCHGHFEFWRRTGTEPTEPFLDTPEKRFWAKVDKNGPIPKHRPGLGVCWLWLAATDGRGRYGSFSYEGKSQRAHRVAFQLLVGPVPEGLEWDHLCRRTLCVRPTHGEWVTHTENVLRGEGFGAVNARKTHCAKGHEFTPENTYVGPKGGRTCVACRRESYLRGRERYNANRREKRRQLNPQAQRRTYTRAERDAAVALALEVGRPEAAGRLGIPYGTLNNWWWTALSTESGARAA
jgi:hypothetical protein